jgi:hypothetical protein
MKWLYLSFLFLSCLPYSSANNPDKADVYVSALKNITDIMVNDVTSPVAASRYYAYTTMNSYEVVVALRPDQFHTIGKISRSTTSFPTGLAKEKEVINGTILGMWKTAAALLPSGVTLSPKIDSLSKSLPKPILLVIDQIVGKVVSMAMKDGFLQLNNLKRYTPKRGSGFWQPTGPAFMPPVEPHWNTISTLVLDSANQFVPLPPIPFNVDKNAPFYLLLKEVYDIVRSKDKEKEAIANFWDCNPYHISQIGHVEFGTKKISPGGHWIGITGIACKKEKRSMEETALIHSLVAMTLHDAFIACWDEKYRSHRVRPETTIREFIDKSWKPILQTPPFPEYLSGHSVASSAASIILIKIFGDSFSFDDDVEVEFGLPVRSFSSFSEAALEASMSRLYGGIHFRDAIEQGIWQGKQVGQFVTHRLKSHLRLLEKQKRR